MRKQDTYLVYFEDSKYPKLVTIPQGDYGRLSEQEIHSMLTDYYTGAHNTVPWLHVVRLDRMQETILRIEREGA